MFKRTSMTAKEKLQSLEYNLNYLGLAKEGEDPILTIIGILGNESRVRQGGLYGRLDRIRYQLAECSKEAYFNDSGTSSHFKKMLNELAGAIHDVGNLELERMRMRDRMETVTVGTAKVEDLEMITERAIRKITDKAMTYGEDPIKIRLPSFLEDVLFGPRIKPDLFPSPYPKVSTWEGVPISWEMHLHNIVVETKQGGMFTEHGKVAL